MTWDEIECRSKRRRIALYEAELEEKRKKAIEIANAHEYTVLPYEISIATDAHGMAGWINSLEELLKCAGEKHRNDIHALQILVGSTLIIHDELRKLTA